eukprot:Em0019g566a
MGSDILLFLLCIIVELALLLLVVYVIVCLSDLECDFLNTTQGCKQLNKWALPEIAATSLVPVILLLSWHWVLFIVTFPAAVYLLRRYLTLSGGSMGIYDPTEIRNRGTLSKFQKEAFIKFGYHLVIFFITLYCPEVRPKSTCSEVEQLLMGNMELHKAVQLCREEYQSTLGTMQALRAARTSLCSSVCDHKESVEEESMCDARLSLRGHRSCSDIGNSSFATSEQRPCLDDSTAFCDTGTGCDMNNPFASPGMELVERMWENFSVDSYAAELQLDRVRPTITIPQPFAMTIREPRRKSRSMVIAEKERAEKAAQMEAEMKKQFRSTPVPASTFLPLYTLIHAKDVKRKQKFGEHTEANVRSPRYAGTNCRKPYSAGCTERLIFKAKPIPKAILDCDVRERMKCEEEYRKVRIKVRAQSLLANSHLPFTSHNRQHSAPSQIHLQGQEVLHDTQELAGLSCTPNSVGKGMAGAKKMFKEATKATS